MTTAIIENNTIPRSAFFAQQAISAWCHSCQKKVILSHLGDCSCCGAKRMYKADIPKEPTKEKKGQVTYGT